MSSCGLLILGDRNGGHNLVTHFSIPIGSEAAAGRDVLAFLADGCEVCLNNDLDEGREGCTFFRKSSPGIETKVAGHGWQGDWKLIDEAALILEVAELAKLNRGGHWRTEGSITRRKLDGDPAR